MANLDLEPIWEEAIRELAVDDAVEGGPDGKDNIAPRQLGNRTEFLERQAACMGGGKVASSVAMRCGAPIFADAGWSRPNPFGENGYGLGWDSGETLHAITRIVFAVPAVSGVIVGVRVRCYSWREGGSSIPAHRASVRLSEVAFNAPIWDLATLTDDAAVDDWQGARTLAMNGLGVAVTGDYEHTVTVTAAWDAVLATRWRTSILSPVILVQASP